MDKIVTAKEKLWLERIQAFHVSGLSRKTWCQENQISLSTFSYWLRKQMKESYGRQHNSEPIFARMPSEQELCSKVADDVIPVTIYLPGSVRIEVNSCCSVEMLSSLLHILKNYA